MARLIGCPKEFPTLHVVLVVHTRPTVPRSRRLCVCLAPSGCGCSKPVQHTSHRNRRLPQFKMPSTRALVVGSGIAGLTTARALQRRGLNVVVAAREWSARTTSAGAGFSRLFPRAAIRCAQ